MCGCRIEGWGGLLPASAPGLSPDVPTELPSQHETTRPVAPSASLLLSAATAVDEEAMRPTREMPSIGHEMRAGSPDHRVHTSPTGNVLPQELLDLLGKARPREASRASHGSTSAIAEVQQALKATFPTVLIPVISAERPAEAAEAEGIPLHVLPEEHTDQVRRRRSAHVAEIFRMLLLALLCAGVAVGVGLFAYHLMLPSAPGAGVEAGNLKPVPPPPDRVPAVPGVPTMAPVPARPPLRTAGLSVHRTRDLVVSVPQPRTYAVERHGRTQGRPFSMPPAGPTTTTALDTQEEASGVPGKKESAPPPAPAPLVPLSEEEQRREAEAQLAAADIEFVASNNNAQVRLCHERAFKDTPGSPGGKVELSFTLNEEGRAVNLATAVNTTGSDRLARCLVQRVAEWRFPRPVGGPKTYQFPFVFLAVPGTVPASGPGGP